MPNGQHGEQFFRPQWTDIKSERQIKEWINQALNPLKKRIELIEKEIDSLKSQMK